MVHLLGPALVVGSAAVLFLPAQAEVRPAPGISYLAGSTASAATASSVTVPAVDAAAVGDVLVARVAVGSAAGAASAPGWTVAGSTRGPELSSSVLVRVVTAAEPAAYAFAVRATGTVAASVAAFRGVDTVDPVDSYVGRAERASSTLLTPAQTTRSGNDVVAWFGTSLESGATCAASSLTQPAAFREVQESCVPANGDALRFSSAVRQVGAAAARPGWRGTSDAATDHVAEAVALRPAGPAIEHRGTTGAAADGRALTLDVPPGTEAGDVLLASVAGRNHVGDAVEAPSGWTLVREDHSSYQISSSVFVHGVVTDDPASWTFRVGSSQTLVGSLSGYSGVDPARPVDASAGRINGASTALTAPVLTTSADHDQAVWFGTQALNVGSCPSVLLTAPSTLTERSSRCVPTLGRGLLVSVADGALGADGAERGLDGRAAGPVTNAAQLVALRAAQPVSVADAYVGASVDVGKLWRDTDEGRSTDLPPTVLDQPSGVAVSRRNDEVAYVHSEKDNHGMVAVSTRDAEVVGTYSVPIPDQWDWEDIATGPCPTGSCIFAGDIGPDNGKPNPPSTFAVYRVPEPDLADGERSGTLEGDWFRFRYPDAPHNAEALMVHPTTGQIYVITKVQDGESGVYTFPSPLPEPSADTVTTLTKVATLHVPRWTGDPANTQAATWYAQVSAAAIHPAGDRFVLRTPYAVWEYRAAPDADFASAFAATPVALTAPTGEGQGEAIDYAPDGSAYYTISEAPNPPFTLKRIDRR